MTNLKCHFDADGWLRGPINIQHLFTPNHGTGFGTGLGVVMHTEAGFEQGTVATFMNRANGVSAFFSIGQDGRATQYLPVGRGLSAWSQVAGNDSFRGIEDEDRTHPSVPLTDAQMTAFAQIFEACSDFDGFPMQITDNPNGQGLILHGDGGDAWGGHYNCLMLTCTDVLTPQGWLPLANVTTDTEVASYATDSGVLTFARPLAIIPPHEAEVIELAGFTMTPDHRMFVFRSDHPTAKFKQAQEIGSKRTNWLAPHSGMLPTEGLGIGGDLMRFLVWVQADGHYQQKRGKVEGISFHLRKERKVQRITEVLESLGKDFTLSRRANGTTVIRVYGLNWLRHNVFRHLDDKRWKADLWRADRYEFAALDEEIVLADGTTNNCGQRFYTTMDKRNADAVQALYVTHGESCNVYVTEAGLHMVNISHSRAGLTLRDRYVDNGAREMVGCLTTQDGTILIRQNGRVAVVGNCPGTVRAAQRPEIIRRAKAIRAGSHPAPAVRSWTSAGELTLDQLAKQELHEQVCTVLRVTAEARGAHAPFDPAVAAYVNAVFTADTGAIPAGITLQYPAGTWVTLGQLSLEALCQAHLAATPAAVLALTCQGSRDGTFAPDVAAYINDVFARSVLKPAAGTVFFF